MKIVKESLIPEGYGAGFSMSSFRGGAGGTGRGGFGGASNLGGPNMMYTYEIKPLNHTLEQLPTTDANSQVEQIQIGSKIMGYPVKSNATPDKKPIIGLVMKMEQTNDGALKYYVVMDEATQTEICIDPLTAKLVHHEPIEFYDDTTDNITSNRREKINARKKERKNVVRESIVNEEEEE